MIYRRFIQYSEVKRKVSEVFRGVSVYFKAFQDGSGRLEHFREFKWVSKLLKLSEQFHGVLGSC